MFTTRREFIHYTLAAGAAAALAPRVLGAYRDDPDAWRIPAGSVDPTLGSVKKADKPLKILILGGTAFLGPHTVEYALARGHTVTLFNRGKTNPHLFPSLEKLRGDRNANDGKGDLSSIEAAVKGGRTWDAVIDTSGYFPRHMDASCGVLKDAVKQYLFVETINVYRSDTKAGEDETGELNLELVEDGNEKDLRNYGPYKALSGMRAEKIMPGRVTTVRPALISGPRDGSDRFTYWPVRMSQAHGDRVRVLAPAPADQPVQYIDVRDLARFCVTLLETGKTGAYNGIGPITPITMGELLAACTLAAGTKPDIAWASAEFLIENEVQPWMELTVWVPAEGEYAGVHRRSTAKSAAAGLVTRPAVETARDILTWWPGELVRREKRTAEMLAEQHAAGNKDFKMPPPLQPRAGLSAEKEARVLALLK